MVNTQKKQLIDTLGKWFFGLSFTVWSFIGSQLYYKLDRYANQVNTNTGAIARIEQKFDLKTEFLAQGIALIHQEIGDAKHENYITVPNPQ